MAVVAEYSFEVENEGAFANLTGNGHDLLLGPNGTRVEGHGSQYAVQANTTLQSDYGAGALMSYPGGIPPAGPITLLFWTKLANMSDESPLVCIWNTTGRGDPLNIYTGLDGSLGAWWFDSNDAQSDNATSATTGLLTAGVWAHIAAVFIPGMGVSLYVNGSVATTYAWQAGTTAFYGTWETLLVGSSRWGSNAAIIDDLRIYDEALSQSTIAVLMNQAVGTVNNVRVAGTAISNMYLGGSPVLRAYVGDTIIYGGS